MQSDKNKKLKKKKIAIFVLDITLKGGIERFVANLSLIFEGAMIDVTIYSLHKTFDESLYRLPINTKLVYLTRCKFKNFIYKFTTLYGCIRLNFIKSLKENNITIISTHPIINIYLYFINKKILNKTIASEHSSYGSHNILIRALRVLAYKKVKSVVTQTTSGLLEFEKFGIKTYKIENPCTEFGDGIQWRNKKINVTKPFVCLSVARLDPVKQLDHYIEAAKIISHKFTNKEFIFQLVGSGPLKNNLNIIINKYGISKIFRIYPASTEVNIYYKNADLYIICSKSEAFPMTMLEAMSYGLPVLSYDKLIGPKEIVVSGNNGYLIKQNSATDLANKIIEIYLDRENLSNLSISAIKSSKEFEKNKIADKWLAII